jgi:hypothetical protein
VQPAANVRSDAVFLLEKRLLIYAGKAVGAFVRTADALDDVSGRAGEEFAWGSGKSTFVTRPAWGNQNCRFQRRDLALRALKGSAANIEGLEWTWAARRSD